jgi:hypothetical protein
MHKVLQETNSVLINASRHLLPSEDGLVAVSPAFRKVPNRRCAFPTVDFWMSDSACCQQLRTQPLER